MSKRESQLKSALRDALEKRCPSFLVMHLADAGGPDWIVAGNGRMTAWEFKHATPDFTSHGNQALYCARVNAQGGHCRYVLWQEHGLIKRTMIVNPRVILERTSYFVEPEVFCVGFDHRWLVEEMRKAHGLV